MSPQAGTTLAGGCWPTRAEVELLLAAVGKGDQVRQSWCRWKAAADWEKLSPAALRLVPQLYWNLSNHQVEDGLLPRLRGIFLKSRYRQALLLHRVRTLLRSFQGEGIPTLLLKGVPIGEIYYGGPGRRHLVDVDLLVPRPDLARSIRVLEEHGWQAGLENLPRLSSILHACAFRGDRNHCIDLHWTAIEPSDDPRIDDRFRQDSMEFNLDGDGQRTLNPTDTLLHTIAHGIPGDERPNLRWIADSVLILRAAEIDWQRFQQEARKRALSARTALALRYLKGEFCPELPQSAIDALERVPSPWFERQDLKLALLTQPKLSPLQALQRIGLKSLRSTRGNLPRAVLRFPKHLRIAAAASGKGVIRWGLSRMLARLRTRVLAERR